MQHCAIIKTNQTGFTVSDLDSAAAFFRDVLGFTITEKIRQSGQAVENITGVPGAEVDIAFAIGAGYSIELLHFVHPSSERTMDLRPCDPGFAHIAFEVESLERVLDRVEAAGCRAFSRPQVIPAGPRKGGRTVYTSGPDGIVIEFQQAREHIDNPDRPGE